MAINVSTKLIERAGDAAFKERKSAIVHAWHDWYHAIIKTMAAQLAHEGHGPDDLISGELGALQAELNHCQEVGAALFGFMADDTAGHDDE